MHTDFADVDVSLLSRIFRDYLLANWIVSRTTAAFDAEAQLCAWYHYAD